jgi:predicted RNA-binding protein YlxR (DUF448 family)
MKKAPQRKCVGCGISKNKSELIRVVRSPENEDTSLREVSIDLKGKKSGRGAYICRDEQCLKKALKARKFDRSLDIKITEELAGSLLDQIKEN